MDGLDTRDNRDDRDRWMAWAGLAFLILTAVMMFLSGSDIADGASGAKVVESIEADKDGLLVAVFLTPVAVAVLLLFTARLRGLVGPAAGAGRRLLQYGAVILASAMALGASIDLALITAADNNQEAVAQALNVLDSSTWMPFTIGLAILLTGAGMSVLRTGVLPAWMGWVALVVGVVSLLGPGGFAGYFLGPLWVGFAGSMLATRRTAPAPSGV